jgi:hypothetical protein
MANQQCSNAIFSECRNYRYALIRIWDENKPRIMFIGLNPSTANESQNDPTIRRVINFAKGWGYGGVFMLNLFSIISSNPNVLLTCADPVDNDRYLKSFGEQSKDILFAWGNFKQADKRAKVVSSMFEKAVCLGLNKNGTPKHPLYIPANQSQVNYK